MTKRRLLNRKSRRPDSRRLNLETLERRELLAAEIWQPLGPFAATDGQVENVSPDDEVVGAIHTVLAHPTDPNTLYIGATNGGVWKTTNAIATRPNWTPLTDDMPSSAIGAMIFDRADPNFETIYAGTGRYSSFGRIGGDRVGLLRTVDGGDSWEVVDPGGTLRGKNISGVYANGDTIVVSVNTADSFDPNNVGVFRSVDGGESFYQVSTGDGSFTGLPAGVAYDLFSDPIDPNVIYTSSVFSDGFGGGQAGVYKSTDQGDSWTKVSNSLMDALIDNGTSNFTGTSNLEITVGNSNNVYVAIINSGRADGIFRSGDGGASWVAMDVPSTNENGVDVGLNPRGGKGPTAGSPPEDIAGGQGTIHFSLVADPNDPFIVYAGGDRQPGLTEVSGGGGPFFPNSIGANDFSGRLFRGDATRPAGNQWVHLTHSSSLGPVGGGTGRSSAPHADSREMVFDAIGNIIEVDDGGIYRRTSPQDNLGDWVSVIGDLQVTEPHDIAWDAVHDVAMSGNQDTGTTQQPTAGAQIWESVSTADGGDVVIDDVSLAGIGQSIRYSSFQFLGAFRRRTYDSTGALISEVFPALQVQNGAPFQGAFRTPVELNSVDPTQLVIQGGNAVYESFDQGDSLVQIPVAGNSFSGNATILQNAVIAGGVLNGVPSDRLLWVGSGSNVLGRTPTSGQLTPVATRPPVDLVHDLAVDSQDWNTLFVNDDNTVAMSRDAGDTWTDITADLLTKASTIWSLSFVDGPVVDTLLAGTNLGIFATAIDALGTWVKIGEGLPNVPTYDMEMDPKDDVLVAGMFGRGGWLLNNATQTIEDAILAGSEPNLIAVAPNSGDLFDLDPQDQAANNVRIQSPTELVLTFGGPHSLDPQTLDAITVQYSETGSFDSDAQDVPIGFIGLDDSGRSVTLRFAENLGDGFYQLSVTSELKSIFDIAYAPNFPTAVPGDPSLERDVISFELELGAKVTSVVAQPIGNSGPRLNDIEVYFDDADLFRGGTTVGDASFYQLVDTKNTVTTEDDLIVEPTNVTVNAADRKVTLTYADLSNFAAPGDSLRLRIGDSSDFTSVAVTEHVVPNTPLSDPGLTFGTANTIPVAGAGDWSTVVVGQEIRNTTATGVIPMVDNPGGTNEPGHRDIEIEDHLFFPRDRDFDNSISTISYSFFRNRPYGTDSGGQQLFNQMNAEQEQRFLEVLDIYSSVFGIDFYEVDTGQDLRLIVGDLSTADPTVSSGPGGVAGLGGPGGVTMDAIDFQTAQDNEFGGSFFDVALHEIGHAIGLGHSYELPPGTIQGAENQYPDTNRFGPGTEWAFPGDNDIVHGTYIHQKESQDVDLYRVNVAEAGVLKAQTFAQRLPDASLLDTSLTLYRWDGANLKLVSANEDYFGSDSYIEFPVEAGIYVVGVASEGNNRFDPDSGLPSDGGTSEGAYELRVDFTSESVNAIRDADGSLLDGDRDGVAGGNFNFWFEPTRGNTIFVDKASTSGSPDGSFSDPFDNIPDALAAAKAAVDAGDEGVVVRLLANGGTDGRVNSPEDNLGYEIGFVQALNRTLDDGRNLELPGGVHLVVDAGVVMKFLDSRVSVGSDDDGNDRSEGTISVQGTPDLPVYFTSFNDRTLGSNSNPLPATAASGDWGGIEIRNDVDRLQGRVDAERLGIFQNYVNHAVFSFGGGEVTTLSRVIDPIHLSQARAEISYNTILSSSDAAMSADPNTFGITTFTEPRFQTSSVSGVGFVTDYERQGPNIYGNLLFNNSTNGLFIRIDTQPGAGLETLEVPARFDDTDIVHVLGENLLLEGAVGGPVEESSRPAPIIGVVATGGGTLAAGDYEYSYTFVDAFGYESPGSLPQAVNSVAAGSQILLTDIPAATGKYVARRLYRSVDGGNFVLVAELDKTSADHTDNLATPSTSARVHDPTDTAVRHGRIDGSLIIDPGTIIKNQGARIQLGFGSTLLAEGLDGNEVIFTARSDDRFGAGGTFDTDGNGGSTGSPADWPGIYAEPTSRLSIDHALVAFAGGETGVNGGTAAFNAIQIHQADARVANTLFEDNADGIGLTQGNSRRDFAPNGPATIFVTAAQPTFVNNTFINNAGSVISINVNAMNAEFVTDLGRQTGSIDVFEIPPANNGPVIRGNRLSDNDINGLDIRGEVLTTEVVWDDTDIVHVLQEDIEIPDLHTFGGMRLESSSTESLVVKANGAEILATGRSLDITDRIGGRLHVLGQPGFPVVITSLYDNTIGAGFTPEGFALTETETTLDFDPRPGDWQGLRLDSYSHDRNVDVVTEREGLIGGFGDANASIGTHQGLGLLAEDEKSGDENIRLGFTVHGAIADDLDQDLYSFEGVAGTVVWIDIDRTDPRLDTVLELIDGDGRVLALSHNSRTESANGQLTFTDSALLRDGHGLPMQLDHDAVQTATGEYRDLYTTNDGDSGMRVVLTGSTGTRNTFYVRVRSSDATADYTTIDGINASLLSGGTSQGGYQLQVRIQETDEHAGSTIRYADLRYASSAIVAVGLPAHSPIAGDLFNPGGTLDLGNMSNTDRGAVSIAGVIDNTPDTYQFNVGRDSLQGLNPSDNSMGIVIDVDWADGLARPNTNAYLYNGNTLIAIGTDSNISDDLITPIVPGQPTTESDLSRGSQGVRDAFIGPLELNPSGNYQVVITNDGQMPLDMAQFTRINPPNTNARLEPIDSVIRIADDRFDFEPSQDTPVGLFQDIPFAQQVAFDDDGGNVVPWHFGDVPLITVSQFAVRNGSTNSQVNIYNPFTGRHDAIVDENTATVGAAAARPVTQVVPGSTPERYYNTVAIERPSGGATRNDGNTDTVYAIDVEGTFSTLGATGISTWEHFDNNDADPTTNTNRLDNEGLQFSSLAFYNDVNSQRAFLYGLANRGTFSGSTNTEDQNGADQLGPSIGFLDANNLIYLLNPNTGAAISRRGTNMPDGFQSAQPTNFFLRDNLGGNNNQFFPNETPWAGTNVVAQVQIPTTFGNVTSIQTDVNGGQFLYAFTSQGAVYRMRINENAGGIYGAGDLVGFPELLVHPLAGIEDADGNTLSFRQVAKGPANYSDVNDSEGISDLYFGIGSPAVSGGPDKLYAFDLSTFTPPNPSISFDNFAFPFGMTLAGNAVAPGTFGASLELTGFGPDETGSGWFSVQQDVAGAFETFFDFRATAGEADGLAFVIQNDQVDALGAPGNGLGYENIANSVAIEFDTFQDVGKSDPTDNHISVHTTGVTGNLSEHAANIGFVNPAIDMNDGNVHRVRISYVPGMLSIYLDDLTTSILDVPVDLAATLNLNNGTDAWLGFTAASGTAGQRHEIFNWQRFSSIGVAEPSRPVFEFGAVEAPVDTSLDGSGLAGMFFSSLDRNLWHTSDTLRTAPGHGMGALDDRPAVVGGGSLRFGFDNLNDDHNHLNFGGVFDNTLDAEDLQGIQGYNVLGGAHGSIHSNSLDLSTFSAEDLPTLYFTYLLDSENTNADDNPAGGFNDGGLDDVMRDSLRVSVAGEDGVWHLVATNNMDDSINGRRWEDIRDNEHEYDPSGSNGYTDVEAQRFVQELFDDDVFRQARIDLGPWAGQEDVRIRFEFSTAGESRPDQSEIHALPGEKIGDGHLLTISGQMPDKLVDVQGDPLSNHTKVFEFDLGLVVQMPAGQQVDGAGSLALRAPDNSVIVELVTGTPTGSQVEVLPTDTAAEVAQKVRTALGSTAVASPSNPSWVGFTDQSAPGNYTFSGVDRLILGTPGLNSGQIPIPIDITMSDIEVRQQIQLALANEIRYFNSVATPNAFPAIGNTNVVRLYDLTVMQSVSASVISLPGNDTIATAQNLDGEEWTLAPNATIPNSQSRPHLTIQGTGDDSYDYFSFTVDNANSVATFDIEAANFDTELHLYDAATGFALATDDDSGFGLNSFIQHTFANPGTYVIGVAAFNSSATIGGITGDTVPNGGTYTLHVSVDGMDVTPITSRSLTLINGELAGASNMPGSDYGVYSGSNSISGLLRAGERSRGLGGSNGVYVDDIVIGTIERGESFTGGNQGTALADNPYFEALKYFPLEGRVRPVRQEVTSGEYQVEVRLGREYLDDFDNDGKNFFARIGVNERLADGLNIRVDHTGSEIVDGDTFELSNGYETLRFEFNDVTIQALETPTTPGNVAIDYRISDTAGQIADTIRTAINSGSVRAVLGAEATSQSGKLLDSTDTVIAIHGFVAADNLGGVDFTSPESGTAHLTGIITGQDIVLGEDNGDSNLRRDQGVFIVDSNIISFSANTAINVSAGSTQPGNKVPNEGNRPKPGPVQNLSTLSTEELVHGAVVQNNMLIFNTNGIVLSGNGSQGGPNVYSRVLNNTVYGANNGITITNQAAPTLLNNVLAFNNTGIRKQNEGPTVIRATVFDFNGVNATDGILGTEAIVDPPGPLFVNPSVTDFDLASGRPNLYPAPGSSLIDSSIESQLDRASIVAVKDSAGIPPSPILVTDRDLAGQLREDGSTSSGQGQNINIDRGALDRSDNTGPQALLIVPNDNDAANIDIDRKDTFLQLTEGIFNFFEILITEDAGIGPDRSTITPDQIQVFENGRQLIPGISVIISYNNTNRTLRIQSPSGIWRPDGVYEIVMLNERTVRPAGTLIDPVADLAGNPLQPNRADGQTRFTIIMPQVESDFGDAPDSYGTLFDSDGARHVMVDAATPRLGDYIDGEPDSAGVDSDDIPAVVTADGNVGEAGDGPFTITHAGTVNVELTSMPVQFDNLAVTAGNRTLVFELVEGTGTAAVNRIPVNYPVGATLEEIVDELAAVMQVSLLDQYVQATVDHSTGTAELTLTPQDDEDGVLIGQDDFGGVTVDGVFLDPVTMQALSFLNPSAANGAELVINTVGGGFVDAWVDFNGDGDFDDVDEQVLVSAPVVDGENRVQLFTPAAPAVLVNGTGMAQARFRLSANGDLGPSGLAIGGEVEDYQVFIADAPVPEPVDDEPSNVTEDVALTSSVSGNDSLAGAGNLQYVRETDPLNGTLIWDDATGDFTYTPNPQFYGQDTFTYRITGEQVVNGITLPVRSSRAATVTLNVAPVNDAPLALDSTYITLEPSDSNPVAPITITNLDLLIGSQPNADADLTTQPPYNELEQTLRVVDIRVLDSSGVSQSVINASDLLMPGDGGYIADTHLDLGGGNWVQTGSVLVTVSGSEVIAVEYTPAEDFNRDNPSLDHFEFVVADDGSTTLPNGTQPMPQPAPETTVQTAFIQVQPHNDPPIANDDVIPSAGLTASPQEDVPFSIPLSFLESNDFAGPATALDENAGINDSPVSVIVGNLPSGLPAFPLTTAQGGTVTVSGGNLVYTSAPDYNGPDSFVYFITDNGDDVALDGTSAPNPKIASATVFLTVEAVNDDPSAFDQSFTSLEDTAIANRPAADLLVGSQGDASPQQPAPLDESGQVTSITALIVDGVTIDQSNYNTGGPFLTQKGGEVQADFAGGVLQTWTYIPATDFNEDDPTVGGLDTFDFVVTDDGAIPASAMATADIRIYPRNDAPEPASDLISASNSDWINFFPAGAAPVPTEDTPLVIPRDFLLANDQNGPATAGDELAGTNDGALSITPQILTTTLGGRVTFLPGGDLRYEPPVDVSGVDSFVYTVTDAGINSDLQGNETVASLSASALVSIVVEEVNDPPTFNPLSNVTMPEDTDLRTVILSGIEAGPNESQLMDVTVVSDDTNLLPTPNFIRTSPSTGLVELRPTPDASGVTVVRVTVEDGGADNDLGTPGDNLTVTQSFTVSVTPVNDAPTLDPIADVAVDEDTGARTVSLVGIDAGGGETQELSVSAVSDNPGLIADPVVTYTSADPTGSLEFTPIADQSGTATITVTVEDAGLDGDLLTQADNGTFSQTFVVTVNPLNDDPVVSPVDLGNIDEDNARGITQAELLAGSSDVDGDTLTAINLVLNNPSQGSVLPLGENYVFTPTGDFSGTVEFTFGVHDGTVTVTNSATLTVNPVNDPPVVTAVDLGNFDEDNVLLIDQSDLLTGSSDVDGDALTATNVVLTSGDGVVNDNLDGTFTFTPDENFNGVASFSFDVGDGTVTVANTASVTVNPVNDDPEVSPVNLGNIDEDGSLLIDQAALLLGSSDVDGDPLTATDLVAESGSLVDNLDGTYTFTPDPDFNGVVGFDFKVGDGTVTVANTAALTVDAVNDDPVVAPVNLGNIDEDGSLLIDQAALLTGSSDADGDLLTASNLVLTGGNGTVDNNNDGTFTFTPATDFNGAVSFSFDIDDGTVTVANTASLTVDAVNDPPQVVAIDLGSIDEDGSLLIDQAALLADSHDVDGDALTAINLTVTSGSGAVNDNNDGTFTFTPNQDFHGAVGFSFDVDDGTVTVPNTASLIVDPVNDPPAVAAVDLGSIDEDGSLLLDQATLLTGSTDVDGDSLTASNVVLTEGSGSVTDHGDGTFTFSPTANFNGAVSFSFDISDGTETVGNTASLTVDAVNDLPSVVAVDLGNIDEDGSLLIDQNALLAGSSDVDGDSLTAANLSLSSGSGTVDDNQDGTFTFTPAADFNGAVEFSFDVSDGTEAVPNTASLTVDAVNDDPDVAAVDLGLIEEDESLLITQAALLTGSSDVDGDSLTASNVVLSSGSGTLDDNLDGTYTFTPAVGSAGAVSFDFDISDGTVAVGNTASLTVVTDRGPETNPDLAGGVAGDDIDIAVLVNDTALVGDLDPATLTIVGDPANGTATAQQNGTVRYVSDSTFFGTDTFTYTIADTDGNVSEPTTVTVVTVESGLQNPLQPWDVNGNGETTALDALLIINLLGDSGQSSIDVGPDDRGPNFYDVNGNLAVTTNDALQVINRLAELQTMGESELVGQQLIAGAGSSLDDETGSAPVDVLQGVAGVEFHVEEEPLVVDPHADVIAQDDVITALAEDQQEGDEDDDLAAANDVALLGLV